MQAIMGVILPIVFFIILNSGVVILSEKTFGKCIPVTLTGSTILVYLSQYFLGTFVIAYYVLIAGSIVSLILIIWKLPDAKIRSGVVSYGLYAFLAICFWYAIIDFGRSLSVCDEMQFWGKMVKEMFRLDSFYSSSDSVLRVHKDYPPFFSLFEMLWCWLGGGYSESGCSMAIHVFMLSLLVPTLELKKPEKWGKTSAFIGALFISLFIILLTFSFDGDGIFQCIYTDYPIVMVAAYAFILLFQHDMQESKWGLLSYVFTMIFVLMGKQIGLIYLIICTIYLGLEIIVCIIREKQICTKTLAHAAIGTLVPYVFKLTWDYYIKSLTITGQFDLSKISIQGFIDALVTPGELHDGLNGYIVAVFTYNIGQGAIPVTFVSSLFVVLLAIYFIHYFYPEYLAVLYKLLT